MSGCRLRYDSTDETMHVTMRLCKLVLCRALFIRDASGCAIGGGGRDGRAFLEGRLF